MTTTGPSPSTTSLTRHPHRPEPARWTLPAWSAFLREAYPSSSLLEAAGVEID
jgi:hypothetical protein